MFLALLVTGLITYWSLFTILTLVSDCDLQLFFYEKFGKSPRRLKGKVVFITGASSGIGEYTAYALAKFGVKLVLAARRNEELQRVKRACIGLYKAIKRKENAKVYYENRCIFLDRILELKFLLQYFIRPGDLCLDLFLVQRTVKDISKGQLQDQDVLVIQLDITNFESHKKHFRHAIGHFGRVDILVNNAGRSQRAIWDNTELSVDKQMFDLNVFGVINLSRVALEYFNKVGTGHIAVVSSLAGIMGVPYSGTYTGTKYAIHGYFNSLRIEKTRKNIHITLLCPGPTFTNFLQESFTEKDGEKYNKTVQPTDKRMTAKRCGYLNAVALANKTGESWIAIRPLISIAYLAVYFPLVFNSAIKILGPEIMFKVRDGKDVVEIKKMD